MGGGQGAQAQTGERDRHAGGAADPAHWDDQGGDPLELDADDRRLADAVDRWVVRRLDALRLQAETVRAQFEARLRAEAQTRDRSERGRIGLRVREQRSPPATPGAFTVEWCTYRFGRQAAANACFTNYIPKGDGGPVPEERLPGQAAQLAAANRRCRRDAVGGDPAGGPPCRAGAHPTAPGGARRAGAAGAAARGWGDLGGLTQPLPVDPIQSRLRGPDLPQTPPKTAPWGLTHGSPRRHHGRHVRLPPPPDDPRPACTRCPTGAGSAGRSVPARPEIPRYPPFLQGLPVVPSADLLATQDELIGRLRHGIGCTPEFFAATVLPVVDRYAAFVHLLPASEAHHHRGAGGLLHHGLEVAFLAGQASHGKVFAYDREPKVRRVHEPLWRLAAALAGLCHDIGKPVSDLSVTDREGKVTWSPMQETIAAWAASHGIDSYFLHWRDRRHNRHESAGMMALERVLGPATIAMLYQADPEIMNALIDAVAGQNEGATLSQLVTDADRASVERDLKTNRIDPQATALGVPIERYLLDAMARLVRTGAWRINIPGARLWMLQDGLHVVWPQGGDEIVGLLAADRVPGIPRHPDTLADLLIERGYATPPDDGDGVRRYWRLAPALLAREGKAVTLSLLRLTSPSLVLSGPAPAVVDLYADAPVRVAVSGLRSRRAPGAPRRDLARRIAAVPAGRNGRRGRERRRVALNPNASGIASGPSPSADARRPTNGSPDLVPVPPPRRWRPPAARPGRGDPHRGARTRSRCCMSPAVRSGSASPRDWTGSALRSRSRSTPCGTTTCWRSISSSPTCACARSTASAGSRSRPSRAGTSKPWCRQRPWSVAGKGRAWRSPRPPLRRPHRTSRSHRRAVPRRNPTPRRGVARSQADRDAPERQAQPQFSRRCPARPGPSRARRSRPMGRRRALRSSS